MPRPKKDSKQTNAAKTSAPKKTTAAKSVKKAPAKKTAEPAAKVGVMLQYNGKDISYDELVQNAKNKFQYDMNGDVNAVKEINLYIKPDENKVYFVINGDIEGDYDL